MTEAFAQVALSMGAGEFKRYNDASLLVQPAVMAGMVFTATVVYALSNKFNNNKAYGRLADDSP